MSADDPEAHSQQELMDKDTTNIIKSKLATVTDLQDYYDALNDLEKQTGKLQNFTSEPDTSTRDRWPTLFEILNKKTQSPLDLWSFYVYMRDEQNSVDYIDFWIDTVQHINLCKVYVKGLRDSLLANSRLKQADIVTNVLNRDSVNAKQETHQSEPIGEIEPPQTRYSLKRTNSTGNDNSNKSATRNSQASSKNSRSSSMLLDLLMKHDLLEGEDPHRLSTFLRGENYVRTSDLLVNAKIDELKRKSQNFQSNTSLNQQPDLTSSTNNNSSSYRMSRINPEMVETLIQEDFDPNRKAFEKSHLISRVSLRKSTRNILNTYFSENSEKRIDLPQEIVNNIKFELETQGRDDPEVFDAAREYIFKAMEYSAYPDFLRNTALRNVTKKSALLRIMGSMICGLAAFWTGYTLIFMDFQPKPTRAVVVIPFFFMSYLFFSAFYRVDPFLCYAGFAESNATPGGIVPIREPYVKKVLRKRSFFVLAVICAVAAAFSVIFALVPGKRLTHSS
ncbi:Bud site selection protein, Revert to axial protein 1 [Pichia californica]|uniref:Bud site selection protein, Revert to axial protein 1 n=1 Tax=Pichia californica TaxID=460514 RepID=A0A9P6WN01_9ASCO|nr:Bud site selection protein, Revert to axial protein 1 [[Candida] californica]KAG0690081.1 Bud site selection protein, Revert to axial protein 1 [[Candida] californica]